MSLYLNPKILKPRPYSMKISRAVDNPYRIVDHTCPEGRRIRKFTKNDGDPNSILELKSDGSIQCRFCKAIVPHNGNN